jgi:hypothetical protein
MAVRQQYWGLVKQVGPWAETPQDALHGQSYNADNTYTTTFANMQTHVPFTDVVTNRVPRTETEEPRLVSLKKSRRMFDDVQFHTDKWVRERSEYNPIQPSAYRPHNPYVYEPPTYNLLDLARAA